MASSSTLDYNVDDRELIISGLRPSVTTGGLWLLYFLYLAGCLAPDPFLKENGAASIECGNDLES